MALNDGFTYRERVDPDFAGRDVVAFLAARHRHSTEEEWRDRLARGEIEIDGGREETLLSAGQTVVWHRPPWDECDVPATYAVIHADQALVAVDKPRGLPTLPGGGFLASTLLALVRAEFPGASPMHRLGRETSGLVLFARSAQAGAALQAAWRAHAVHKRYRALGSGVPAQDVLQIDAPIGPVPHPRLGTVHAASPGGKPAHSRAAVLARRGDCTLFEVAITTGRPHQIRIHLAFAGHPLVGDPLYAAGGLPRADRPGLPGDGGYFLHAERLSFAHPITGAPFELRAPPPPELQ